MNNYFAGTIVATGLIILLFGVDCTAQSRTRLVADVPFDFYVGSEKLPEGRYEFEPAGRNAQPGAIIVRALSGSERRSPIVSVFPAGQSKTSEAYAVIFNRYGSVHYLSRVNLEAGDVTLRLAKTSGEREIAKQLHLVVPVVIRPAIGKGN